MKIKELSTDDVKAYRDTLMKLMHLCYEATCPGLADDAFCGEKVDGLYQYLKDGKANLFGAVDGDRLVGFHWCYEYSFLSQRRYHSAYAAVLPEAAGRGIFSALYAAAEDKARELGIHVIELSVGQMNQKVIDIHKSHGYEIERVIMKKLV
ncbi:MAG: GNAT family N-acetyltransferase [Oscillibacter sp.]|jgi:GNAT superfamily N-acetyltransferase|nr:GNAT family N-acetyltransferase [Oscillibacter sp.]